MAQDSGSTLRTTRSQGVVSRTDADSERSLEQQASLSLDSIIEGKIPAPEAALDFLDALDGPQAADGRTSELFAIKRLFATALVRLRLGETENAKLSLASLQESFNLAEYPEFDFRCRSMLAAILLMQGERSESLREFEQLLAEVHSSVSSHLVERARINFAAALSESGQTARAMSVYEELLITGLTTGNPTTTLQAGNNLVHLLLQYRDLAGAERFLDELRPTMAEHPQRFGTRSLELKGLMLLTLRGQLDPAREGLEAFLADPNTPSTLVGPAHRLLAGVFLDMGKDTEALKHARQAVKLCTTYAIGREDARIQLAKVWLHQENYAKALETLESVDLQHQSMELRRKETQGLKLQTQLLLQGMEDEAKLLSDIIDADQSIEAKVASTRSEYLTEKLERAQDDLSIQTTLQRAEREMAKRRSESQFRTFFVLLFCTTTLIASGLIVLFFRRQHERMRLAEQITLNGLLEEKVEEKSLELTQSLTLQAKLAQELQEKKHDEDIAQLAGTVAHDFRNLLQVIFHANASLANPHMEDEAKKQLLQSSNESLKHGTSIMNQLLAFSRRQELAKHQTEFTQYLAETEELFRSFIGSSLQLCVTDDSRGSVVEVDAAKLTTAILNILSNARDSMPRGGRVHFLTERHEIREENLQLWKDLEPGDFLLLSIVDEGVGMHEDMVSKAFEPFFTTKKDDKGTGLGLSSVYGFVKQSGGDIRLRSQEGVGTRVDILLPLAHVASGLNNGSNENEQGKNEQGKRIPPPHFAPRADDAKAAGEPGLLDSLASKLSGKSLLLVEDNQAVSESLIQLLKPLHMNVRLTDSGDEAVKILESPNSFDIVLSDISMPGSFDGVRLARWVRENRPHTPILLMSGYNNHSQRGHKQPLLRKPFSGSELTQFLADHIEHS